jgi:hypothetical protein
MPSYRGFWTSEEDARHGIQSMLVCIEMLGISLAHKYCFSVADYTKNVVLMEDWSRVDRQQLGSVSTPTTQASPTTAGRSGAYDAAAEMTPLTARNGAAGAADDEMGGGVNSRTGAGGGGSALPSMRPRPRGVVYVPPARRRIGANIKLTLKQPDIWNDVRDIVRGA